MTATFGGVSAKEFDFHHRQIKMAQCDSSLEIQGLSTFKAQNLYFFSESSTKTFETVADRQIVRLSTLSLDRIDEGCLDRMTIFYPIFAKTGLTYDHQTIH